MAISGLYDLFFGDVRNILSIIKVGSCFLVEPIVGVFTLQHPVEATFARTSATQSKT